MDTVNRSPTISSTSCVDKAFTLKAGGRWDFQHDQIQRVLFLSFPRRLSVLSPACLIRLVPIHLLPMGKKLRIG